MPQQNPILIVSDSACPAVSGLLAAAGIFPVIETKWPDAQSAFAHVNPVAVIARGAPPNATFQMTASISAAPIYTPFLLVDPDGPTPPDAIRMSAKDAARLLVPQLIAALRVRALHAAILRRLDAGHHIQMPNGDSLADATVLLAGRKKTYAALSLSLGQQVKVIGALSIEAAARHLNLCDVHGIVLADGFTPMVGSAFLKVLSEDPRFRHMPVIAPRIYASNVALDNLAFADGNADEIAANAFPLVRQRAFEIRLKRIVQSLDSNGERDPQTGLLTAAAFGREREAAQAETENSGVEHSMAQFSFDAGTDISIQAAQMIAGLIRGSDFGAMLNDRSIAVVLANIGVQEARPIVKRLTSLLRETLAALENRSGARMRVTLTALARADIADPGQHESAARHAV